MELFAGLIRIPIMHRTTIFIPDDLHFRLRDLGWRTRTSISLLLELAAREALGELLLDEPAKEVLRRWDERLRRERFARDRRMRWNRRANGSYGNSA